MATMLIGMYCRGHLRPRRQSPAGHRRRTDSDARARRMVHRHPTQARIGRHPRGTSRRPNNPPVAPPLPRQRPLQQTYSITVEPPPPLTDATVSPLDARTVDTPYAANFFLSGGVAPHTWSFGSPAVPARSWADLDRRPDRQQQPIRRQPSAAGTSIFTMKVTDGRGATAAKQVSITIDPRPPLQISGTVSLCHADGRYRLGSLPRHPGICWIRALVPRSSRGPGVFTPRSVLVRAGP
jgi:hypothetical protein